MARKVFLPFTFYFFAFLRCKYGKNVVFLPSDKCVLFLVFNKRHNYLLFNLLAF